MDIPKPLMRTEEAAHVLGVSRSWLEKARIAGKGPPFIRLQRNIRYRPEDLHEWTRAHRVPCLP